jgi:DNA-directed RNA polymerase specialized sigma24 family protein
LPPAPFPSDTFAEFYRFAVLLTGKIGKAEQVMAETLSKAAVELAQIRNETSRRAWFATRIRERCLGDEREAAPAPRLLREEVESAGSLEVLEIEAYLIAQRFHQLPEPGRSALALFYLDTFTNQEIAKLLKLHEDELADTLGDARRRLQHLLAASQS